MARLLEQYKNETAQQLKEVLGVRNPMAVPRLTKIVVSMGTGSPTQEKNRLPAVSKDLAQITGQKPQVRRARKAVSNFKIRRGNEVGCRVTLRGVRMYEFFDRLVNAAIPRMRDFRGLSPSGFDGRGNYTLGVSDQSIFAEIDLAKIAYNQGMNITLVTSARTDVHARELLSRLGLPLKQTEEQGN